MSGDDAPVPIAGRPWFKEALDEPDPVRSVHLHTRNLCWILQRVVPLLRALETAATLPARLFGEERDGGRLLKSPPGAGSRG